MNSVKETAGPLKTLPRRFKYDNIVLDDIDPETSPEDIMASYADIYPDLANGTVEGPEMTEDALVYTFRTRIGTKGTGCDKKKAGSVDFSIMDKIFYALTSKADEEVIMPPSEFLEVI